MVVKKVENSTQKKVDLRVIKTKKNIEQSFLKLLEENRFEKITIQMILEEALISKGTFYAHYLDKYDLAQKITEENLKKFRNGLHFHFLNLAKASQGGQKQLEHTDTATHPTALKEVYPKSSKIQQGPPETKIKDFLSVMKLLKKFPVEIIDVEAATRESIRQVYEELFDKTNDPFKGNELLLNVIINTNMGYLKYIQELRETLGDDINYPKEYYKYISLVNAFSGRHKKNLEEHWEQIEMIQLHKKT